MGTLTYDIALVFIPGLICAKLYFTLTSFRRPGYAEMAGYSLVLGFLCYLGYSSLIKPFHWFAYEWSTTPYFKSPSAVSRLIDAKLELRSSDIIFATLISPMIAIGLSFIKNKRLLFRLTAKIGASLRYSTDSVFVAFSALAQNQYVRIWKSDRIAYEGTIHLFYEHPDMYEIVLSNVIIITTEDSSTETEEPSDDSADTNTIAYLYVRWNKSDDVLIEQTEVYEPSTTDRIDSSKKSRFGSLTEGASKWFRKNWPSSSPSTPSNETPSSPEDTA